MSALKLHTSVPHRQNPHTSAPHRSTERNVSSSMTLCFCWSGLVALPLKSILHHLGVFLGLLHQFLSCKRVYMHGRQCYTCYTCCTCAQRVKGKVRKCLIFAQRSVDREMCLVARKRDFHPRPQCQPLKHSPAFMARPVPAFQSAPMNPAA